MPTDNKAASISTTEHESVHPCRLCGHPFQYSQKNCTFCGAASAIALAYPVESDREETDLPNETPADSSQINTSSSSTKSCSSCGKALSVWNRHAFSKQCVDCAEGRSPSQVAAKYYSEFEKTIWLTEESIRDRPISATAPRLFAGAGLISIATFAGAMITPHSAFPSIIGCVIGLVLTNVVVFGSADTLDKRRWRRFWKGDLLGYWCAYVPLFCFLVVHQSFQNPPAIDPLTGSVLAYVGASICAFVVGLTNVAAKDEADKEKVLAHFRQWQKRRNERNIETDSKN